MEISLEKIDTIRERTGCSYKEAKKALEKAGGDLVDALILIEEEKELEKKWTEEISVKGTELITKIKELIKKGNVTKIRVKQDDKILVEFPVTAGAVGALLVPHLAILGVIAAMAARCTLEVEKNGNDEKTDDVQT
jgi:hypothetical protein